MVVETPVLWLYVQAHQSIRIQQSADKLLLLVCGPGSAEHSHTFDSSGTLEHFLGWYTTMLVREGWTLHMIPDRQDRRTETGEFPPGTDRRRCNPAALWSNRSAARSKTPSQANANSEKVTASDGWCGRFRDSVRGISVAL